MTGSSAVAGDVWSEDQIANLIARVSAMLEDRERVVLGIVGAPGSGKSTLTARLEVLLAERGLLAGCVPMDGFHMSNAVLELLGRHHRKGAPDTFDVTGYIATLDRVRAPHAPEVLVPVYRRDLHEPVAAGSRISGSGVVLTEGNYLALDAGEWSGARSRIDLLLGLDVPLEELVRRLVARHEEFGKEHVAACHWVRTVDVPNAQQVAASLTRCDEIWHAPALAVAPDAADWANR